jgi:hypothetical protein
MSKREEWQNYSGQDEQGDWTRSITLDKMRKVRGVAKLLCTKLAGWEEWQNYSAKN